MKAVKRNVKLGKQLKSAVKASNRGAVMAKVGISASTLERWMKLGVPENKKALVTEKLA